MSVCTTSTREAHGRARDRAGDQGRAHVGAMTAAMRAVAERGEPLLPRLLRVGRVQAGRVIEDRLVNDRGSVTVGTSERATFIATTPATTTAGALFTVFDRVGGASGAYDLCVVPGMTGRVALGASVVDIADLVAHGRGARLRLPEAARGRVTLSDALTGTDTTFLFQFVVPPLAPARPELPLSVKGGLAGPIDWTLTVIAAFSFLLHFGVVGSMYSDWMDPVIDAEATVTGVMERLKDSPDTTPETAPPALDDPTAAATAPRDATPSSPPPVAQAAGLAKSMSPTQQAAMRDEAAALGLVTLTALTDTGSAVRAALTKSDLPLVDLGEPARSAAGAEATTGEDLNLPRSRGPVEPGSSGTSLGLLAHTTKGPDTGHPGESVTAGPRRGDVTLDPVSGPGEAALPGASQVIAGLRAGFRSCYNAGLSLDATMSGKVTLNAKVAPNGEVAEARAVGAGRSGLSDRVVECLLRKLKTAQFEGGHPPTSVQVPVSFIQQR